MTRTSVTQHTMFMILKEFETHEHPTMESIGRSPRVLLSREMVRLALNQAVRQGLLTRNPYTRKARAEAARREKSQRDRFNREKRGLKRVTLFLLNIGPPDENGCRVWQGGIGPNGYGYRVYWNGKYEYPHRIAWVLAHGSAIPDGFQVNHLCNNRLCMTVGPDHAYLGTQAENMQDRDRSGRNGTGLTHYQKDHEPDWRYSPSGWRHCTVCNRRRGRETYMKSKQAIHRAA